MVDANTDGSNDGMFDVAPDAPRMATLVQQATTYASTGESLSVALGATPTNGNVLVMIGAAISGSLSAVSGGGATWTLADRSLTHSNIEIWVGVTNGTSGTVKIERPGNDKSLWITVTEWSGLANAPLDASNAIDGTGISASAGTITTTHVHDLIIFAMSSLSPNAIGSPSPGMWTALTGISNTDIRQAQWYRVETAAGMISPSVAQTQPEWEAGVVALRIAQ